jgi:predicted nuclease of predicted toxin-antitoxin system
MKILADENCELEIVVGLRALGHDVVTIAELAPSLDDPSIFAMAQREGRLLLTNDQDFGVIAEHARLRPPAVVLLRLERVSPPKRVQIAPRAFDEIDEGVSGTFFVVEPHQIRSRLYEPKGVANALDAR